MEVIGFFLEHILSNVQCAPISIRSTYLTITTWSNKHKHVAVRATNQKTTGPTPKLAKTKQNIGYSMIVIDQT